MKKAILLAAISIVTLTAKAQQKKKDTEINLPGKCIVTIAKSNQLLNSGTGFTFGSLSGPQRYIFFNTPEEVMRVTAPDSTGMITVRFNRHLVKFINDSTFTFKQLK